jgi:hypothetical protein
MPGTLNKAQTQSQSNTLLLARAASQLPVSA